ncbi:hypothetical protein [Butyricimonas paravirosa]|jgi:hypothetical protein|uniref:hypothetical protein n=1 Tax=Butyricimonas paravirosa TaxID=1472417 RepID=UPI002058F6D3|nr:hypothetical protein [Butyricimonas paravirosa]DAN51074.1 MAG TPA: hypothetical protein [Caudoviricetes sp.]
MSDFISISICLSDIPKDRIKAADNGKKYINLAVTRMKEPDKYEQTHTVFVSQSKEEREAREDKIYVGKGKEINFTPSGATVQSVESMPAMGPEEDDLPF